MKKVIREVLKAFSLDHVNVEEARRLADLKRISLTKAFHDTIDINVLNVEHAIPIRIFFPNKEEKEVGESQGCTLPILIYLHGGGWVTDGIENYGRICDRLSRYTLTIVISVDYRLAPEHKFPIGLEDCFCVVKSVYSNTFPVPILTQDITLVGDSAGGNLVAALCQKCRNENRNWPMKQVLIYPALSNDYSVNSPFESVHKNGEGYLLTAGKMQDFLMYYQSSETDLVNPYFAPIIETNLVNLPRTLIVTAENDPLRDEGEAYGMALRAAGNEVDIYRINHALHGFFGLGINSAHVRRTLEYINNFLQAKGIEN